MRLSNKTMNGSVYGLVKVYDHNIIAINKGDSTIIARVGKGSHTIDLNVCADNFKNEYGTSGGNCVGDRNVEGKYFCLNTSGVKTMICFKRLYVCNLSGGKLLFGNRIKRFHQLQKAITQLGYSTYDLT